MPGIAQGKKDATGLHYFEVQLCQQNATDADQFAQVYALIDTGTNVTIISLEIAEQLGIELTDKALSFSGVGTADVGSVGTANVCFILQDENTGDIVKIDQEVAVKSSMSNSAILGLDMLSHFDIHMPRGGSVTAAWD
ncbi:MAG: retroviral-like aspartic protease family protein [Kordiimonadaceae bacterium]|nr:retroviral-like aspartic protease family protein [Kordiimonadaceae bacterium]